MQDALIIIRQVAAGSAALIAAGIIYLSLLPSGEGPDLAVPDKLGHFMAYAVLTFPLTLATGARRWFYAVALACLLGLALEIAQAAGEAGRQGSGWDMMANLAGSLAGAGIALVLRRLLMRRR